MAETKTRAGYVTNSVPKYLPNFTKYTYTIQRPQIILRSLLSVILRKLPATGVDEGLVTGLVTLLFAGCIFDLVSRKGRNSSQK
ncbi:hypothetical protein HCQ94_04340 [Actinomyces sp. zg-332]|uniref:hypothetical protein n=1 Tax=Actinomyces sp. zg-332 TaxID=2708340 RepID=UPI00141FE9E3|nr:hypothetical protein [Actinomyces sp. zg-332]QPK93822.1 hypothetical protein HCQ94_04340 [Actinomyces sp. zg-332]